MYIFTFRKQSNLFEESIENSASQLGSKLLNQNDVMDRSVCGGGKKVGLENL